MRILYENKQGITKATHSHSSERDDDWTKLVKEASKKALLMFTKKSARGQASSSVNMNINQIHQ